jgi:hypothetical protein
MSTQNIEFELALIVLHCMTLDIENTMAELEVLCSSILQDRIFNPRL